MPAPKIEINQYVVFKYSDEWQEGRIVDYTHYASKIIYKVFSLRHFIEVSVQDHILISSYENMKKIARSRSTGILQNTKLKEILKYDEEERKAGRHYFNTECTLEKIFKFFTTHLLENKIFLSRDEILLSVEGLRNIVSECEPTALMEEGIVLGIKICCLTMTHLLKHEDIREVRDSVHLFCVYFLDYLLVNSDIFYNKGCYQ